LFLIFKFKESEVMIWYTISSFTKKTKITDGVNSFKLFKISR